MLVAEHLPHLSWSDAVTREMLFVFVIPHQEVDLKHLRYPFMCPTMSTLYDIAREKAMEQELDRITIEYMVVADGAHSVGGKLYVLGGGWDHLFVPTLPGPAVQPFALAVSVKIPWHLTNRRFACTFELTDADNQPIGDPLRMDMEQGRPPGSRQGSALPLLMALSVNPHFPQEGRYVFHGSIDQERLRTVAFEVHQAPQPPRPTPAQGQDNP